MQHLTDELLLESYHQALRLKLSEEFLELLLTEIRNRNLSKGYPSPSHLS